MNSTINGAGELLQVFKALGEETRINALAMLTWYEELCVCDLAALTGTSDSAMSHQLRRLKDLALVKNRREGQILYYSLDDHHVAQLLETTVKHLDH